MQKMQQPNDVDRTPKETTQKLTSYVMVCPCGEETPIRRSGAFPHRVICPSCGRKGRARWIKHLNKTSVKMIRGILIFAENSVAYRNWAKEKQP